MNWKTNLGLSVILLVYILVGALVFWVLEHEEFTPPDIRQMAFYTEFLANHTNVTPRELEEFTHRVIQVHDDYKAVAENSTPQDNGWSYDSSLFFTITVVSTIGFGHITPTTTGGKLFCMFFALVGIPMAMALLASMGARLRKPIDRLHAARPWVPSNPDRDKHLKSAVVLTVGTAFMLCVPAVVFTFTEDWDYATAIYYSTITLTTVGFGDYVAAVNGEEHAGIKVIMSVWLIVGLAYVALVISEVSQQYATFQRPNRSKEDPETPKELPELNHNHHQHDNTIPEPNGRPAEETSVIRL